ncbi:MAG: biotin/lipoyl-containing protein [Ignavibacteriota bacterium]
MAIAVEVPKLGNSVEECIIGRWLKRPGDPVSPGDAVAEIETDKTTFEVTAPVGGSLLATFFEEGAVVPVFTNFFVVGNPGESAEAFRPQGAAAPTTAAVAVAVAALEPVAVAVAAAAPAVTGPMRMSPRARRFAEVHNFHPAVVIGSGPGGRILEEDIRKLFESRPQHAGKAAPPIASFARPSRAACASRSPRQRSTL